MRLLSLTWISHALCERFGRTLVQTIRAIPRSRCLNWLGASFSAFSAAVAFALECRLRASLFSGFVSHPSHGPAFCYHAAAFTWMYNLAGGSEK